MSAEKKASTALTRAKVAYSNNTVIMEFLKDLPMTLSLDHLQAAAYKKAFDSIEGKIH